MLPGTLVLIRRLAVQPPTKIPFYRAPLEKFERWLETKHPKVYKVQRTVVDGGQHCFADLKTFYRVSVAMKKGKPLEEFTRQELEVYVLTPTDIEKLLLIAFVIALPLTPFIMAAALVFFPRLLLTRHFWTLDQTEKFRSIILEKRRQHHYGKIADSLAIEIQKMGNGKNAVTTEFLKTLKNPPVTLKQLENYADLIQKVNLDTLSPIYQLHLSRAHGLWTFGSKNPIRLRRHAQILATLDSKLSQEKVDDMTLHDLKQSLYLRQFDIVTLSDDEERQLLKEWLHLSRRNSSSPVLLHAPVISQLDLDKKPKAIQ